MAIPMQTVLTERQEAWIRAAQKARRLGTEALPVRGVEGTWMVKSSKGDLVTITRTPSGLSYRCNCEGGRWGVCYHAAAVAILPEEIMRRRGLREGVVAPALKLVEKDAF